MGRRQNENEYSPSYIQFLIAAQRVYTCTEAAHCAEIASHDAYTK